MSAGDEGGSAPARARRDARFVFVLALVVRLVYLWSLRDIPFFDAPSVDGAYYDRWAQRIAAGEWLGGDVFFLAPAYPYFLGTLYAVFGRSFAFVHGFQMVLGAGSCVLIYLAGRRIFGRGAGLTAGIILALYPPVIFYDGLIHKTPLLTFLTALFLCLLARALDSKTAKRWVGCGLVGGLLALTQENMLVLLFIVPAWGLLRSRAGDPRLRASATLAFGLGMAGPLLFTAARNFAVGSVFALTTSNAGQNFYIGNNPEADGLYAPLVAGRQNPEQEREDALRLASQARGLDVTPSEASAYWFSRGWDFIQEDPVAWMKLFGRKLLLTWNRFEAADADDMYVYADWSGWFGVPVRWIHFGVLAPIGLTGLVLARNRARQAGILPAILVALTMAVAAFFVFGRYRLPLVPILALFAGAGAVELTLLIRARQWRRTSVGAVTLLLSAGATNWPLVDERAYHSIGFVNLGSALARQDRLDDAAKWYERALSDYPDNAPAHYQLGLVEQRLGHLAKAESRFVQATVIQPDLADAQLAVARLLAATDRNEEAARRYREFLRIRPEHTPAREELQRLTGLQLPAPLAGDDFESLFRAATTATQEGRFADAIRGFTKAAELRTQDARPFMGLAAALIASQREEDALPHLRHAVELDPGLAGAHAEIGRLLADQGDLAVAIDHYRKALALDAASISTRYNLATALASLGRLDEAVDAMQTCLEYARKAERTDLIPRIEDRLARLRAERDRR